MDGKASGDGIRENFMEIKRIVFVSLLVFSVEFIFFYGGKVPYVIFYTLALTFVLSLAYAGYIAFRFRFMQHVGKENAVRGDRVRYDFIARNNDFFPYPAVRVAFDRIFPDMAEQAESVCFTLMPGEEKSFSFELECAHRGCYALGVRWVKIRDLLGLFDFTVRFSQKHRNVFVQPKIIYLERFQMKNFSVSGEDYRDERSVAADGRYMVPDIRKYRDDGMNSVHWKMTAKMNELMVKSRRSMPGNGGRLDELTVRNDPVRYPYRAVLIPDLKSRQPGDVQNLAAEDRLIEAVISLAAYCVSENFPVRLLCCSDEWTHLSIRDAADFQAAYALLSHIRFARETGFGQLLRAFVEDNPPAAEVILFTAGPEDGLDDMLAALKRRGYDITLIYISVNGSAGQSGKEIAALENLRREDIRRYCLGADDDMKSVLEHEYGG